MGRHFRVHSVNTFSPPSPRWQPESTPRPTKLGLTSPFGNFDGLDHEDFREVAYEVIFTSCRSSPGFGGRSVISYYNANSDCGGDGAPGSPLKGQGVGMGMAVTSHVKRALGLKMMRRSPSSRRSYSFGSDPSSPSVSGSGSSLRVGFNTVPPQGGRMRRPMTSAEIMRQQMRVTEQSDNRLRKTLMRTLVGQMGRRAETIILPLELMRHLKPSEFDDAHEYHVWQMRQLKLLEAGLLLYPCIPLEKSDPNAMNLREIIIAAESKPIDTAKNSETMRTLSNSVVSLAWRSHGGTGSNDGCHWADGYPLNVRIYTSLLSSIFDLKEETLVLDEVDELLELMKKTWSTLGINRSIHHLCFTWVLFEQYILTGQVEADLLGASLVMLAEVATDAKKGDREAAYVKILGCVLSAMTKWVEKRLLDYHGNFSRENIGLMENMLSLLFSTKKILVEDVPSYMSSNQEKGQMIDDSSGVQVDHYIRSSMRSAFAKMVEEQNGIKTAEAQDLSEVLVKLARKTEELAAKEKNLFTPILKKWHPIAAGVAAVSLHACYGTLLKKYMTANPSMINEIVLVLQRAGKLEKALVQVVVEDSVDGEDGGKAIVREMVPYEVESLIYKLLKQKIQEKLQKGKEHIMRAKQTETWNPKSKTEPYAHSAAELVSIAKEAVESFFDITVSITESLFHDFVDGLENMFKDYITFVASCGSKQSYIPTLPPLTRCSKDSKFFKLWKKAACSVGVEDLNQIMFDEGNLPRPSTSRGTQRLYIRLNTLNYLVTELHSLDKTLSVSPKIIPVKSRHVARTSYFETNHLSLQAASQHVSEIAAYRLIFLDSISVFYGGLYVGDVANSRIRPAIRILKQNLTLLCAIVVERAQPLALKEVVKASFEAFLMVLLAGGTSRQFTRMDHPMIEEDFESLKRVFCTCGEGLIVEDAVEREAEAAEGLVAVMGQSTEQLVEEFCSVSGNDCGFGGAVAGQKVPMPPTTGKWNRYDPNTILRILCYRDDRAANHFLKKTFQLAKRRPGIRMI